MQAIVTKYLPATETKGSRIKATCAAGTITLDYHSIGDGSLGEEGLHAEVARQLKLKMARKGGAHWDRPTVCGCLPDGSFAHVFTA